jgi:hypothetical protein
MAQRPAELGPNAKTVKVTWDLFKNHICKTLADTGAKVTSCEAHGVSYAAVFLAIQEQTAADDPEWEHEWDLAMVRFRESLIVEARARARDGWDEPVFYKGDEVGYVRKKSDRMMELMLKAHIPEFQDRLNITGTLQVENVDIFADLSITAKKQIRAIMVEDMKRQSIKRAAMAAPPQQIEGEFLDITPPALVTTAVSEE